MELAHLRSAARAALPCAVRGDQHHDRLAPLESVEIVNVEAVVRARSDADLELPGLFRRLADQVSRRQILHDSRGPAGDSAPHGAISLAIGR